MKLLSEPIFSHALTRERLSDQALIAAMVRVEVALAEAQEELGIVPPGTADAIGRAEITGDMLADGVAHAGVPVPALLAELRAALPEDAAQWVHYGATSQDILDTALCFCFKGALEAHAARLSVVIDALEAEAARHQGLPVLGRTRGQLATPISYALRCANWAAPLLALEAELDALEAQAFKVQLGGSAGSASALGTSAETLRAGLAARLGLTDAPAWHTDRGGVQALASWLTRLTAALAKFGRDIVTASRGEVAEITAGVGGGSSTMPHKSNPITAEALQSAHPVALAFQAGLTAAAVQGEERDGVFWAVEWRLLPELLEVVGAALEHAVALATTLRPDADAMAARIAKTPAAMTEAAVFALAPSLGRIGAEVAVKEAVAAGQPMTELLAARGSLNMPTSEDLARHADEAATAIFAKRRR